MYTCTHTQIQQEPINANTHAVLSKCISNRYIINITDMDTFKRISYRPSSQKKNAGPDEDAAVADHFEPQMCAPIVGAHYGYVYIFMYTVSILEFVH